jgi:hypothetical protein
MIDPIADDPIADDPIADVVKFIASLVFEQ